MATKEGGFDPSKRRLCPDGSCLGLVTDSGRCNICGRTAAGGGAGAGASASGEAGGSSGAEDGGSGDSGGGDGDDFFATPDGPSDGGGDAGVIEAAADFDPSRRLCDDGACTGVVGAQRRLQRLRARGRLVPVPSVAVIGASSDRAKFGNRAVRAYLRQGWTVFPVNPREPTVEGLTAYPDIEAITAPVDRAALYVPPDIGQTLLAGIARKQVAELFVNPGAESDDLLAEAERLGLPVIQACSITDIGERP